MLTPRVFENNFVDDLFDEMFRFPYANTSISNNLMSTDVKDLGDKYELDIELPGYNKSDVHAELNNGYLTISAAHTEEHEENKKHGKFVRKERYTGQCQRSFYLGEKVTQDDIKGKFDNGVLTIVFPKVEEKKEVEQKKYIAIE